MRTMNRFERWATNTIGVVLYVLSGQWLRRR